MKQSFRRSSTPAWISTNSPGKLFATGKTIVTDPTLISKLIVDETGTITDSGGTVTPMSPFDNIFESDFYSMSCPDLLSAITAMNNVMASARMDAATFSYYSGQLSKAQGIYDSKCVKTAAPVTKPPASTTTTTPTDILPTTTPIIPGPVLVTSPQPGNINTLLPVLTPVYTPPSKNISPAAGGGGAGGAAAPEKKKKKDWWWLVALILVGTSAYFTNKQA